MPVLRRFDFTVGDKGFMLARSQYKGRAWLRMGRSDSPGERTQAAAQWGALPDELDHPEVWNDWSGGYGHAYRKAGENTYHWAENFDARSPRQLVHCQSPRITEAALGAMETMFDLSAIYPTKHTLVMVATANPYGAMVLTVSANHSVYRSANFSVPGMKGHPAAVFGSYILFPNTTSTVFGQIKLDDLTFSAGPANGFGFAVANNVLWRVGGVTASGAAVLQNVGNPAGVMSLGAWGATYNLGGYRGPIRDLAVYQDQVFVGLADGLYAGDQTGTFVNVTPAVISAGSPDNFRSLATHDNRVVGQHVGGIVAFAPDAGVLEDISPPSGHKSPIIGLVRALKSHGPNLYAGLYTGSHSRLLARNQYGVWHTLQRIPGHTKVNRLYVDSMNSNHLGSTCPLRLWVMNDAQVDPSGTFATYYWEIPNLDGNPLSPSPAFSANYIGSARIDLGSVDWGAPGTPKLYRAVEIWADNLASGAQWAKVYYTIDNEGTRHLLGTTAQSPKDTLYFPHAEGSFVTGQAIELSLESFTASAAVTPIYRSIILRGALQPRSVDLITAKVRIADGVRDRMGAEMRSGATMLKDLRDFGDVDVSGGQAYQLIDLAGAPSWVKVVGRVEEEEYYQAGDDNPEIAATVRLAVLDYE